MENNNISIEFSKEWIKKNPDVFIREVMKALDNHGAYETLEETKGFITITWNIYKE